MRVLPVIAATTILISTITGFEIFSTLLVVTTVTALIYVITGTIDLKIARKIVPSPYEWLCLVQIDPSAGHEILEKMQRSKNTRVPLEVLMEVDLRQLERDGLILSEPIRSKSHPMRARNREYKLTRKGYAKQKNHSIHLIQQC